MIERVFYYLSSNAAFTPKSYSFSLKTHIGRIRVPINYLSPFKKARNLFFGSAGKLVKHMICKP